LNDNHGGSPPAFCPITDARHDFFVNLLDMNPSWDPTARDMVMDLDRRGLI